jgi:hypothetical protein
MASGRPPSGAPLVLAREQLADGARAQRAVTAWHDDPRSGGHSRQSARGRFRTAPRLITTVALRVASVWSDRVYTKVEDKPEPARAAKAA